MTFYVIVRGPLGIGKTTVCERLAFAVGGQRVGIDEILEEHDLEEWKDGFISEQSFLRANDYAVVAARELLARGVPAVVDGNFYWRSAIDDLLDRLAFPREVFTLKAPLAVCIDRDAHRAVPLGEEGAREGYSKVGSFEFGRSIDATGSPDSVVASLLAGIEALRAARP